MIAGTNGKGTTLALIEDILIQKGLKVGSYTSPHLVDYNERICINKLPIDDSRLIESFKRIETIRDDILLTYFEFGTLAAFITLKDLNCDAWLIEVGLGGRLDATNIISPSVSLITNVDFDHQEWLENKEWLDNGSQSWLDLANRQMFLVKILLFYFPTQT